MSPIDPAIVVGVAGVVVAAASVAIAAFSSFTASDALRHARDTAYTQLRPWVCYEDARIELIEQGAGQRHLTFSVRWKNSGASPARCAQVILLGVSLSTTEEVGRHVFEIPDVDERLSGLVGPQTVLDSPTWILPLNEFRSGTTLIYSRITYKDIFSEKTHESDVRLLITAVHKSAHETIFFHQIQSATAT